MLRYLLVVMVVGGAAASVNCTGGCWDEAGAVSVEPATDCLTLYQGQYAGDDTVCGTPDLGGTNGCSEPLTLPPTGDGAASAVIQPGSSISFQIYERPGVTVLKKSSELTHYVIDGKLGEQSITITMPVRRD